MDKTKFLFRPPQPLTRLLKCLLPFGALSHIHLCLKKASTAKKDSQNVSSAIFSSLSPVGPNQLS